MTSKAKIMAKGSFLRISNLLFNIISSLFLMPFLIHALGDKVYGLWVLIVSIGSFYWLFDLGVGSALERYVSKALAKNDHLEANQIINTTLFCFLIFGVLFFLFCVGITFFLHLFIKDTLLIGLAKQIVLLLGLNLAVGLPMRAFSGILSAHMRFDIGSTIELLKDIIRVASIVIFFKFYAGIWTLALITCGIDVFGYILLWFVIKRIAPYFELAIKHVTRAQFPYLFNYSMTTFVIKIADRLRYNIDNFVISAFVDLNAVTMYSVGFRLNGYLGFFVTGALGMFIPLFSRYEGAGDYENLRSKFLFLTKISAYFSMFLGGMLIILGGPFIQRWMGSAYMPGYYVLVILAIPSIFASAQNPSIQLLYGVSKHKFYAITNIIEGVMNLVLSLILVKKMGMIGVAWGTAIPMAFMAVLVQPVYVCKIIKYPLMKYYSLFFVSLFKGCACLGIVYFCINRLIAADYLQLIVTGAIFTITYSAVIFFWGFSSEERNKFLAILKPKPAV
ncbi:MAG: polysaccharide biosynthesis C-terminal domain-containing protein [Candidatus Omnitrophica bacterium]|nr:polysaccharide biosynthesis C-terminal domain-containing protein [Candidatus Omnitrophota bacterium]